MPGASSTARYRARSRRSALAEPRHRPRSPALDNNGRAAGLRAAPLRHPRIHHRSRAVLPAPSAPGDAGTEPPPLRAAPGTLRSPRAPAAPLGGRGPPETWRGRAPRNFIPRNFPPSSSSLPPLPPSLPPGRSGGRPPAPLSPRGRRGGGRGSIAAPSPLALLHALLQAPGRAAPNKERRRRRRGSISDTYRWGRAGGGRGAGAGGEGGTDGEKGGE